MAKQEQKFDWLYAQILGCARTTGDQQAQTGTAAHSIRNHMARLARLFSVTSTLWNSLS